MDDMTVSGVRIAFETASEPTTASILAAFTKKFGRPDPRSEASDGLWAATKLPTSGPLRRLAAEYLHAENGGRCAICESQVDLEFRGNHPAAPTLDRVAPGADGGEYVWGNVRVAHRACNAELAAGSLPVAGEWARELLAAQVRSFDGELTRADVLRIEIKHAARMFVQVRAELDSGQLSVEATAERVLWAVEYQDRLDTWPGLADMWERQRSPVEAEVSGQPSRFRPTAKS